MPRTGFIALAIVLWIIAVNKLGAVRQKRKDRRIVTVWLGAVCISISISLRPDLAQRSIDNFIGINNLAWLLNYLFVMLAFYLLCASLYIVLGRRQHPALLPSTALATGLLIFLFCLKIVHLPENVEHEARTIWELLFKVMAYAHNGGLSLIVLHILWQLGDKEDKTFIRFRVFTIQVGTIATILFYVLRLISVIVGFLAPSLSLTALEIMIPPLQIGSYLGWLLFLIPNRFYLRLTWPLMTARKLMVLRDLRKLETKLTRLLMHPTTYTPAQWWHNPDLSLYRTVINILDGKKELAERVGRASPDSAQWRARTKEAVELHRVLQNIPDHQDFDSLVTTLRKLASKPA